MTTMEIEAGKARLVKEILMEVNDKEILDKISAYLQKTLRKRQSSPCCYATTEELKAAVRQGTEEACCGMGISVDELMKESELW